MVLETDELLITEEAPLPTESVPLLMPPDLCKTHWPKWERCLGPKLVICSLEKGPNCIMVHIHLRTTDTMEASSTECMVDTGATGDFIDQDFVTNNKLLICKLSEPNPVHNLDSTLNEAGSIRKVVDVIMTYKQHSECILLAVTHLIQQSMILGMTWLCWHNLEIDFHIGSVKMTCCLPAVALAA